jgi:hypothetical protein
MVTTIRDHCPGLDYFELTGICDRDQRLSGLYELMSATRLRIDLDLLVGESNRYALLQPDNLVPPSLTTLDLMLIDMAEFARDLRVDRGLRD